MRRVFDPQDLCSMPSSDRIGGRHSIGRTRVALVSWELRLCVIALSVGAALLWSVSRGSRSPSRASAALVGHDRLVEAVAFSPDGGTLASCGFDHTVRLWDAGRLDDARPTESAILPHSSVVYAMAFAPDGSLLATAGFRALTIWSCRPSYDRKVERSDRTYHGLTISPDGRTLALGAEDGTIRLCELPEARERMVLRDHSDMVRSVAFSPDGKLLASSSQEGRVVLWDAIRGARLRVLIEKSPSPIRSVAFSPDGRTVGVAESADEAKDILLFDADTGAIRTQLTGHLLGINALSYSPDGRTLATAGVDHCIKLWDLATAKELAVQNEAIWLKTVAFSPDGRWLAYAGGDEVVRLLDLRGRRPAPAAIPHSTKHEDRSTTRTRNPRNARTWKRGRSELATLNLTIRSVTFSQPGRPVPSS